MLVTQSWPFLVTIVLYLLRCSGGSSPWRQAWKLRKVVWHKLCIDSTVNHAYSIEIIAWTAHVKNLLPTPRWCLKVGDHHIVEARQNTQIVVFHLKHLWLKIWHKWHLYRLDLEKLVHLHFIHRTSPVMSDPRPMGQGRSQHSLAHLAGYLKGFAALQLCQDQTYLVYGEAQNSGRTRMFPSGHKAISQLTKNLRALWYHLDQASTLLLQSVWK